MVRFYKISELANWDFTKHFGWSMTRKWKCGDCPHKNIAHVRLDDLVGYEIPKKKLIGKYRGLCRREEKRITVSCSGMRELESLPV